MKFLSNEKYEELKRVKNDEKTVAAVEKRFDKKLRDTRSFYEEKIEDLEDEHNLEVKTLKRKVAKAEQQVEAVQDEEAEYYREELSKHDDEQVKLLEKVHEELAEKRDEITILNKRVESSKVIKERQLQLEDQEADLKVREAAVAKREKNVDTALAADRKALEAERKQLDADIAKLAKRTADKKDAFYKEGYTDGVSDTLREGNEKAEKANERVFSLAETSLKQKPELNVIPLNTPTPASK